MAERLFEETYVRVPTRLSLQDEQNLLETLDKEAEFVEINPDDKEIRPEALNQQIFPSPKKTEMPHYEGAELEALFDDRPGR